MHDVRRAGDAAVARAAARFGDKPPRALDRAAMCGARERIEPRLLLALESAAERIEAFAELQRASLQRRSAPLGGFELSHCAFPVRAVGIYVPAGRYPLVSSLLMGVIPARVAGVERVIVCTPEASDSILAAASSPGPTKFIKSGAHKQLQPWRTARNPSRTSTRSPGPAIVRRRRQARGHGNLRHRCNRRSLGSRDRRVGRRRRATVAADLLAQAEHDEDAASRSHGRSEFAEVVDSELERQLPLLSTEAVARASIERNGRCVILPLQEAIDLANALAPEHLELQGPRAEALAPQARCFGALFVGAGAAEVFGDYGSARTTSCRPAAPHASPAASRSSRFWQSARRCVRSLRSTLKSSRARRCSRAPKASTPTAAPRSPVRRRSSRDASNPGARSPRRQMRPHAPGRTLDGRRLRRRPGSPRRCIRRERGEASSRRRHRRSLRKGDNLAIIAAHLPRRRRPGPSRRRNPQHRTRAATP